MVYVQVKDHEGRKAQFRLGDDYRVNPAEVPVEELEMLLGCGERRVHGAVGSRTFRNPISCVSDEVNCKRVRVK